MYEICVAFLQLPGLTILLQSISGSYRTVHPRLSRAIAVIGMLILYILSTPIGAYYFVTPLYNYTPMTDEQLNQAPLHAAIVVLGGGRQRHAVEYGGTDTVSAQTLARMRYAAWIYEQTKLPILVSGGSPHHEELSEAKLMADVFVNEWNIPIQWLEQESRNTDENGKNSLNKLLPEGVTSIYLVTDAEHMARALYSFRATGVLLIPAAVDEVQFPDLSEVSSWLPLPRVMFRSSRAMHEYFGLIYYTLKGLFSDRIAA